MVVDQALVTSSFNVLVQTDAGRPPIIPTSRDQDEPSTQFSVLIASWYPAPRTEHETRGRCSTDTPIQHQGPELPHNAPRLALPPGFWRLEVGALARLDVDR